MAKQPRRQRSAAKGRFQPPPQGVDLRIVAEKAVFVGDSQHKDVPFFVSTPFELQPRPRRNERGQSTLCPHEFSNQQSQLTELLRKAIVNGQCEGPWKRGFPQRVWVRTDGLNGRVFQARHSANGKYKGWPEPDNEQWPEDWK